MSGTLYVAESKIPSQGRNKAYKSVGGTAVASAFGGASSGAVSPSVLEPYLKVVVDENGVAHIRCLVDFVSELGIKGYAQSNVPDELWEGLPTASTTVKGGVKVDGTTIGVTNGVISVIGGTGGGVSSWNDLTDKPAWLSPSTQALFEASHAHSWEQISGRPTTLAGYGITDAATSSHSHTFSAITSKPTTLVGYGITDAATATHNHAGIYEPTITKATGYAKWTGSAWSFVNESYSLSTHNHAGTYEPVLAAGTSLQFYRGDKTWQTLNSSVVPEVTNLYFTEARVRTTPLTGYTVGTNTALAATDTVLGAFNKVQAQINAKENTIAAGTSLQYRRGDNTWQTLNSAAVPEVTNLYWTQARFDTAFSLKTTANLVEATNLYFTESRVRASVLTGYTVGINTVLAATDSVLAAFGKVQAQINAKESTIVAGTTSQYRRGDNTWQNLTTAVVSEVTNLYFTNARAVDAVTGNAIKAAGQFYTGTTAPTNVNRVNFDGYIYATQMYSGNSEVINMNKTQTLYNKTLDMPSFGNGVFIQSSSEGTGSVLMSVPDGTLYEYLDGYFRLPLGLVSVGINYWGYDKFEVWGNARTLAADGQYFFSGRDTSNNIIGGFKRSGNSMLIRTYDTLDFSTANAETVKARLDANGNHILFGGRYFLFDAAGNTKGSIGINSVNSDLVLYNGSNVKVAMISQAGDLYAVGNVTGYSTR